MTEEPGDHLEVLAAGHRRLDRRVLAGEPDQPAHLVRVLQRVDAGDVQRAGVRPQQGRDRPHERGLARAVRAEQRDDVTVARDEVEAVERVDVACSCLGEAAGLYEWCHCLRLLRSGTIGVARSSFDVPTAPLVETVELAVLEVVDQARARSRARRAAARRRTPTRA